LGGLIFWWGYLHKKLEKTAPLANMLIIGIVWGLWYAPLILFEEYHYAKHPLGGVVMMPLFTIVLSPLMLYFKHKGRGILIPAIFFATLHISATFRSKFHWNYGNDLIDGVTGIKGIIVLFFCSCVALILLWKQGALNTQAKQPVENDVKMVG